jgi:hypothetical protein
MILRELWLDAPSLFDVDGIVIDDKVTTSSETIERGTFKKELVERDGICVLSGELGYSVGLHIIPFSKGNGVSGIVGSYVSSNYLING